jgi:dolichol-phosphate mannosyltransferase
MDFSVVIPALNEAGNLPVLLEHLQRILPRLTPNFEILVVDGGSSDDTVGVARRFGLDCWTQSRPGLTRALLEGFARARGTYILTMDGDHSHDPNYIESLWAEREKADLVIASRYVRGGNAEMPILRWTLSRILNQIFRTVLSTQFRDLSSNFRLYRAAALRNMECKAIHYDGLPEILIRLQAQGRTIREVPFTYKPRLHGQSKARIVPFARAYIGTLYRMWVLRRSILSSGKNNRG